MTSHVEMERRLKNRMAELRGRVARTEAALDEPGDPDVEDQASARQGDEVLEGLEGAALGEIKAIEAALGRLETGSYGACVACGEPIAPARLDAIPHAARCADCA